MKKLEELKQDLEKAEKEYQEVLSTKQITKNREITLTCSECDSNINLRYVKKDDYSCPVCGKGRVDLLDFSSRLHSAESKIEDLKRQIENYKS